MTPPRVDEGILNEPIIKYLEDIPVYRKKIIQVIPRSVKSNNLIIFRVKCDISSAPPYTR